MMCGCRTSNNASPVSAAASVARTCGQSLRRRGWGRVRWRDHRMTPMTKTTTITLLIALATEASAAESYACVGEQVTGLRWTGTRWEEGRFRPSSYLIVAEAEPGRYSVRQSG